MEEKPDRLPIALKVVAALFILGGLVGLWQVASAARAGYADVNPTVLGLLIGPGLLWRSRACWLISQAIGWLLLVLAPILAVLALVVRAGLDYTLFGFATGRALWIGFWVVIFLVALYCLRALTSPAVRAAFGIRPRGEPRS